MEYFKKLWAWFRGLFKPQPRVKYFTPPTPKRKELPEPKFYTRKRWAKLKRKRKTALKSRKVNRRRNA